MASLEFDLQDTVKKACVKCKAMKCSKENFLRTVTEEVEDDPAAPPRGPTDFFILWKKVSGLKAVFYNIVIQALHDLKEESVGYDEYLSYVEAWMAAAASVHSAAAPAAGQGAASAAAGQVAGATAVEAPAIPVQVPDEAAAGQSAPTLGELHGPAATAAAAPVQSASREQRRDAVQSSDGGSSKKARSSRRPALREDPEDADEGEEDMGAGAGTDIAGPSGSSPRVVLPAGKLTQQSVDDMLKHLVTRQYKAGTANTWGCLLPVGPTVAQHLANKVLEGSECSVAHLPVPVLYEGTDKVDDSVYVHRFALLPSCSRSNLHTQELTMITQAALTWYLCNTQNPSEEMYTSPLVKELVVKVSLLLFIEPPRSVLPYRPQINQPALSHAPFCFPGWDAPVLMSAPCACSEGSCGAPAAGAGAGAGNAGPSAWPPLVAFRSFCQQRRPGMDTSPNTEGSFNRMLFAAQLLAEWYSLHHPLEAKRIWVKNKIQDKLAGDGRCRVELFEWMLRIHVGLLDVEGQALAAFSSRVTGRQKAHPGHGLDLHGDVEYSLRDLTQTNYQVRNRWIKGGRTAAAAAAAGGSSAAAHADEAAGTPSTASSSSSPSASSSSSPTGVLPLQSSAKKPAVVSSLSFSGSTGSSAAVAPAETMVTAAAPAASTLLSAQASEREAPDSVANQNPAFLLLTHGAHVVVRYSSTGYKLLNPDTGEDKAYGHAAQSSLVHSPAMLWFYRHGRDQGDWVASTDYKSPACNPPLYGRRLHQGSTAG